MEKNLYKTIYYITLCNSWHRSLSWPNTQHIQKLATEDLYNLRYCRSRFFTFVFFMQKLTGISSGKNNKSCRIFHHESNKIDFAFFWFLPQFSTNFTSFSQSTSTIGVNLLQGGPRKESVFCNVAPGRGWPARRSKILVRFAGVWPGKDGGRV
jgi:hypothetical protein